ncbi:hypothetical protein [Nitrosopumilus sp. S6]
MSESDSKDEKKDNPFDAIKSRLVTGQISSKDYEKMKKFLEKNGPPKNLESNAEFFNDFMLLTMRFAWGEIDEKEFKQVKKILEKEVSNKSKKNWFSR